MTLQRSLLLLALLCSAACASTPRNSALYRREIGNASGYDAVTLGQQIINRYGYELESTDSLDEIRMTTHWRARRPFADEQALGVTNAETRLVISARPRSGTDVCNFYSVILQVENRLRVPGSADWNETLNTPNFRAYADELTNEYKRLVTNIGVRRC